MEQLTKTFECCQCGWLGPHEYKKQKHDGDWKTDVCPVCSCESFFTSITVATPCDICGEILLVLKHVGCTCEQCQGENEVLCPTCYYSLNDNI